MLKNLSLWPNTPPGFVHEAGQEPPGITLYPADNARGAVLVLPGGGYQHKAAHEGGPVAERLNREGIFAAVLDYRVAPYRAPVPQWDALRAVQMMRSLAPEYGYNTDHIAILGFSAGGHLAASAAFLDISLPETGMHDPVSGQRPRPDAAVLCYPVITMGKYTHQGSRENLLGMDWSTAAADRWSVEKHISHDAPPAFLWHTSEDGSVPVQNSLMLASALSEQKVPFSLHIWPRGRHGLGLAEQLPDVSEWPKLAAEWLHQLGY